MAARGGLLTDQIRSAMEAARTGMLPSSMLTALKISGDLGIGTAAQAAMAADRGSLASSFATAGAVAEALKSLRSLSGADGVLAGRLRDPATAASAMKQAQTALGISGAILSLNAAKPLPPAETFARATRWSVEQSLVGGALGEIARNTAFHARSVSLLMDGATRTAAESWRTIMDGVMGTLLAGLRPSVVAAYAGMHRSSLPVLANIPGFALPRTDGAIAGHLADQIARMRTDMSDLLSLLRHPARRQPPE